MARKAPWKKANPRKKAGKKSKKLSPSQKASANRSAKKAGRRYPSLVDNMRAASKKKKRGKFAGDYRPASMGRSSPRMALSSICGRPASSCRIARVGQHPYAEGEALSALHSTRRETVPFEGHIPTRSLDC